ncbi:hybrid sensor histidine kinase/response regulator [Symmachiella dynata]|uniref:hybrid sensor histidine kinase/response regulator n=1 Tax=Symmachiella dynata TaxID=2527995 RepID=UPI00118AC532|nr:ATP-binding protein [Symmachiella dynata]QDT50560.1 Sensor protein FixL [Symmachiella dynata]
MATNKTRVLLVEDDDNHAFLIQSAFTDHKRQWQIEIAKTIEEARQNLNESPPELVIVDFVLPDGRGTELLPASRTSMCVPYILMTSQGNEAVAVEAIKGGALDYVVKSEFSLAEMPRTAERVLREWELIVERQRAKDRENELFSLLAHADRKNAMGEMATALAHEVNQPLAAIANYAGTCLTVLPQNEERYDELRDALLRIDQQVRRAGDIIRRLKCYVSKSVPETSLVGLNHLILEVANLVRVALKSHNVELELQLDDSLPQIRVDTVQIQQVIVNLVQNALESMVDMEPPERIVRVITTSNSDNVSVDISDCGRGIPHELSEKLFEPHFTTKSQGLGMGLTISRRIIEDHDGQLTCSANPKHGSTFRFSLPRGEQTALDV